MKKFLSLLLVFAMVIGMAPAVFATESAKEEYVYDNTVTLALGDNAVTLNETAYTTVFAFTPDEAATYTFTVPEGYLVGYWGGGEYFMWDSTGDAKTTTLEWTVTDVGQTVMVGITGEGATTLTIAKGNAFEEVVVELQTYVNKATPAAPDLSASAAVEYVDVMGETTHTAVLGSDGYYHLDSADGAVLIVDMNHLNRLADALEGGRGVMYAYITDDSGNVVEKWDIGDAVLAYEAACDENGYCYLTEDLMFFYGEYAEANGVYSFVLGDGYNADCAWMYACLTVVGTTVQLDPGESWPTDNAWYAAYYWNGASNVNGWAAMTDADADGIYEGVIPTGYDNVIFVRLNPASTAMSWDNKWNQTVDLTVPTDDANLFTIENPWNESYSWNATGSWSALTVEEEEETVAGTGTEEDPYIITSLPYDVVVNYADLDAADAGVFYQYTAEQDGVLEGVVMEAYDMTGCLFEVDSWVALHDGETITVTEGETYLFWHFAYVDGPLGITLQYAEDVDSGDDGDDSGDTGDGDDTTTPDSGDWSGTDVALAVGECVTIVFTPETDGVLTADITGNPGWVFFIDSEYYGAAHWSDDPDPTVSENLTAGVTYTIEIAAYDDSSVTNYVEGTVSYELTWTSASAGDEEPEVIGSGTAEDPFILQVNAYNNAVVAAGQDAIEGENVIYFYWEATADGTLTLTFDESDPEPYVVFGLASGNGGYTHQRTVSEGDVLFFSIETYEYDAADYTFYAAFDGESGEEGGDGEVTAEELYDGDNYLSIWAGEGTTPYTYTATQTGTLYLTFTEFAYMSSWGYSDCSDYLEGYFGIDNWGSENWTALTINGEMSSTYYGCVEVTEGEVIDIGWVFYGASEYVQTNYDLYATLNLNYDGYKIPEPGSIDDPYEMYMDNVDFGMNTTETVAADASVYYYLYYFYGSTVTITGEGDFAVKVVSYETDENYNQIEVWTTYTAEDGYLEFYADNYTMLVEIVNNSDADAAYTVGYYYPTGHVYNPEVIVGEGTWTATLEANSNGYYYSWTADEAMSLEGMMTITVSGTNGSWQYSVDNYGQYIYGDYHYSSQDGQASEDWTVFAGDYFNIWVNTDYNDVDNWDYDTPAGEVTITITFEEKELVQGVDYPYSVAFNDIYYYGVTPEAPVAAGAEAWINVTGFEGYDLVVYGAGASITIDGVTYTDDDGDGILKVAISAYDVDATLANTSSEDVTYTFTYEAPLGHNLNPQIITENGKYATSEFVEGSTSQYYFQYTATKDGTITVEVLNDTYWQINLWNKSSYSSAGSNYKYATSNTFTLDVAAGDIVSIYGRTYSYDTYSNVAGTLSFNFTFEEAPEAELEYEALVLGDNTVGFSNTDGENVPGAYSYTAEQDGTLYLTLSDITYYTSYNDTLYGPYNGRSNLSSYTKFLVNGEALSGGYLGTIEVKEGDVVTVVWNMKYPSYKYIYSATLNLSYEGYNPAPGSEKDPYELNAYYCPAETVEIPAGSTVYYNLKYFSYSYITVTGEGAYIVYNDVIYTDDDGDGVVMLYADSSPMLVQIGNSGDSAAAFTVGQYYPVGHQMNPVIIESEGAYVATVDGSGDAYYFEFEADCDCDITLTFNSEQAYEYAFVLNGMAWDESAEDWSYWGAWNAHTGEFSITFELMQGDYVQIIVNTQYVTEDWDTEGLYGSYPAGSIDMDVAFEYYHVDKDEDCFCDLCGADLNEVTVVYGDLNGDGEIDLLDANLIVSYYNGTKDLTEEQLLAADVNGDGEVDLLDANMIVSYYNGTLESFPAEKED